MSDWREQVTVEKSKHGGHFNRELLSVARDARKMTQTVLASRAGVTQAALSMVENGLYQPSENFVEQISSVLNYPKHFFYQQDQVYGLPPYHYFRRKKLSAKMLSAIIAEINIRTIHIRRLLKSVDFEAPKSVPQYDIEMLGVSPSEIARRIREYWLLPRGPIKNLTSCIESSGCIIVMCNLGSYGAFDAVSVRHDMLPPLIFIDRMMPSDRFYFTLAHEFGHLVMHTVPLDDKTMEEQAHEFASNLLMPREDILAYLSDISLSRLARVKPLWKVAISALIKRASDLNLMSSYEARDLWMQYSKAGYRKKEPAEFDKTEPTTLLNFVRYHMDELRYKALDMANMLCLHEEEFQRMYLPRPRLRLVT